MGEGYAEKVTGRTFVVDDAWFEGCFHDAFEGEVEVLPDGSLKAGKQGIRRTKGFLSGLGTGHSAMTLSFQMDGKPVAPVKLEVVGLDDSQEAQNRLVVQLNGQVITEDLRFPNNENIKRGIGNDRYYVGWSSQVLEIPSKMFRQGLNTLTIRNVTSCFDSSQWNYAVLDQVIFTFAEDITLEMERKGPEPVLYEGLTEGPEVNAWPTVNLGNRLTLLTKMPQPMHFFITVPRDKPLGKGETLAAQEGKISREILLHLETDADVEILTGEGQVLEPEHQEGKKTYTIPIARLHSFETPHPAQGVSLLLRGEKPFESKELDAWVSIDGIPYRKTKYALSNMAWSPLQGREKLNFDLGIWGGGLSTKNEKINQEYMEASQGAGFNQVFTGGDQAMNTAFQNLGFKVFPRYGWFGGKFKVTDDLMQFAAIDQNGNAKKNDFCPLAILEHASDPEMGKFFQRAEKLAQQKDINGICVDYETAPVWCYCDRCLAKFQEEEGVKITGREQVAPGGPYAEAYANYGRRRSRDLLAKVKETIQKQNPLLQYHALASASDIPSYWYDGRKSARHSVQELVKFADAIYASCYFYEIPGGMKSVIPIIRTVKEDAYHSGRDVETYVISPVSTTISEFPRYRGAWMQPDFTKLLIQLAGMGGARGVLLFRGDGLDGSYFKAAQEALADLLKAKPYMDAGVDRSDEVQLFPIEEKDRLIQTEVSSHLLARLIWHPASVYTYDVVQWLKDTTGKDRLITLFNFSSQPQSFRVDIHGLFDADYQITDFLTSESLGEWSRIDLESGKWEVTIPARTSRFFRVEAKSPVL